MNSASGIRSPRLPSLTVPAVGKSLPLVDFVVKVPLLAAANSDSVSLTRTAREIDDDGAALAGSRAAFLFVQSSRSGLSSSARLWQCSISLGFMTSLLRIIQRSAGPRSILVSL